MKHIHMDEFAKLRSPLHAMDPRAKAVAFFIFIFLTVTLTNPILLLIAVVFWIIMLQIAKIPIGYIFRRLTWILPFAGFLIILFPFIIPGHELWSVHKGFFRLAPTVQGLERAFMLFLRLLASVLAIITLTSTTRFNNLMKAVADLKIPAIILQLVEFTIRYIYVTIDELKRMRRARKSRGFVLGKNIWHSRTISTLAQMVGIMFIRSYERGDRVYVAMLSRGFTGKINSMSDFLIGPKDYILAGAISFLAIALFVLDKGGFVL